MEKVSLYDQNDNKMYEILLSSEDARRAASDITFATTLLNAAIVEEKKEEQNEVSTDVLDTDSTQSDVMPHNNIQSDRCKENSIYRWSEGSILLLLRTYEEMEEKFNNGKSTHTKCWELIAKILKNKGYDVTGPQCSSKFRGLKKTYKAIKDHNSKSGNDRRTWQYLEVMDNMFSKKAWCKPVALASSTGLSIKNVNTEESSTSSSPFSFDDSDTEKENHMSEKSTKIKSSSVAQLLAKRLAQKQEHESKRQKRHEDRMAIEKQLLETLTQFLNKLNTCQLNYK